MQPLSMQRERLTSFLHDQHSHEVESAEEAGLLPCQMGPRYMERGGQANDGEGAT